MNVLIYLMVYYANIFQPILTYTNDSTKFILYYEMEKVKKNKQTTTLCMCHGPEVYNAAVVVTWVPCPYLQK